MEKALTTERPAVVMPNAPSPTPEMLGIAGAPGAWATCPADTAADWCAKTVTIPPPGVGVVLGPLQEPPSAVFASASVGQVAALVVAAAVVGTAAVVRVVEGAVLAEGDADGVVGDLLLPELQRVKIRSTVRPLPAKSIRFITMPTIDRVQSRTSDHHEPLSIARETMLE